MKTVILILLIALSACHSPKKTIEDIKKNQITDYTIIQIAGVTDLSKKPSITLNFISNELHGNTTCNQYGGHFITDNQSFQIGGIRTTKMYCIGVKHIEKVFLKRLSEIASYKVSEHSIYFYDKSNVLLMTGKKKE